MVVRGTSGDGNSCQDSMLQKKKSLYYFVTFMYRKFISRINDYRVAHTRTHKVFGFAKETGIEKTTQ